MNKAPKILAFAGSNSPQSINQQLVIYVNSLLDEGLTALIDLRDFPMPVFGKEILENEGAPENAKKLRALFADHEAFIISIAEYNQSVSSVFKNAMDWASKAGKGYDIFQNKPVLLIGTSPSPGGARIAIEHAAAIVSELGGKVVGKFSVPGFYKNVQVDENGFQIKDENVRQKLNELIADFEKHLADDISGLYAQKSAQ